MANALVKCLNSETMKRQLAQTSSCKFESKSNRDEGSLSLGRSRAVHVSYEIVRCLLFTAINQNLYIFVQRRFNSSLEFSRRAYNCSGPRFELINSNSGIALKTDLTTSPYTIILFTFLFLSSLLSVN